MFNFFKGLKSKVAAKSVANDQVLFSTDTGQLNFDMDSTRHPVKDPTAGKALSYANKTITLSDAEGNTLSSVDITSSTNLFWVDIETGHLMYIADDTLSLANNLTINGDLTVNGSTTLDGTIAMKS